MFALYRRHAVPIFWISMLIVYGLAIMPSDEAPTLGMTDKTDHMAAFFVLTLLGRAAWWSRPAAWLAIGLSVFGAFIEISQAMPFIGRDADVMDWIADSAAILVALAAAIPLARLCPRAFAS